MIEIITHCFAGDLPQYAVFLRAQLSSIVLHRPRVPTHVVVCCNDGDEAVMALMEDDDFSTQLDLAVSGKTFVDLVDWVFFSENDLFRRSIGRNLAALQTQADLVWFCDVDHYFGPGCLDGLWAAWHRLPDPKPAMVYPADVWIHKDHATGDAFVARHRDATGLIDIDHADFARRAYRRAIGGVQIVSGDFARQYGYLDGHRKWQRPTDGSRPFPDFRDDVAYRKFCGERGGIQRIDIPALYRLRHTATTYK